MRLRDAIKNVLEEAKDHQNENYDEDYDEDYELEETAPIYNVTHPEHGVIGTHSADKGFVPSKPHLGFKPGQRIPDGTKINRGSEISSSPKNSRGMLTHSPSPKKIAKENYDEDYEMEEEVEVGGGTTGTSRSASPTGVRAKAPGNSKTQGDPMQRIQDPNNPGI